MAVFSCWSRIMACIPSSASIVSLFSSIRILTFSSPSTKMIFAPETLIQCNQGVAGQVKIDHRWSTSYCPKPQPRKDELRRILQVKGHQIPRSGPQLEEVCSILTCPCMHFLPCVIPLSRPDSEGIRVVIDGFFMEVEARCAVLLCCIEISVLAKRSD